MNLKPIGIALLAAGVLAASSSLAGNRMTRSAYAAEKERVDAEYKSEVERCAPLSGNSKDICKAEAKAKQMSGKADAYAAFRGTEAAATDALIAHADADYAVAKEKCDDLAGNAKDVCLKEAKAAHTKAKVDANANSKVSEVRRDAADEKRDANYDVARQRCDALAGDAKTRCIDEAKARFGKS